MVLKKDFPKTKPPLRDGVPGSLASQKVKADSDWFWSNPTVAQLAERQGVKPIDSVEQIGMKTLSPDDAEDMIEEVRKIRSGE